MANITIESSPNRIFGKDQPNGGPVWTSSTIGYYFYMTASDTVEYRKTTDGGETWGSGVNIYSAQISINGFAIWFDKWTPGDSGTKIHVSFGTRNTGSTSSIRYRNLDTSSDSLSSAVEVVTIGGNNGKVHCPISKSRAGNLHTQGYFASPFVLAGYKSTDGGASWFSIANAAEIANEEDRLLLFPGNETDTEDMWAVFWDDSATELSLKTYDDSLNSWSETSISGSIELDSDNHFGMSGSIKLSNNHLIFASWNDTNSATGDIQVWDINGSGSITAKTNVINNLAGYGIIVSINQSNDDIYVGYGDGSHVYYKKSTDGGSTWGTANQVSDASTTVRELHADLGNSIFKLKIAWWDDGASDILINGITQLKAVSSFYRGNSIAIKPTLVGGTALFKEKDTGDVYYWDGAAWLLFSGPT